VSNLSGVGRGVINGVAVGDVSSQILLEASGFSVFATLVLLPLRKDPVRLVPTGPTHGGRLIADATTADAGARDDNALGRARPQRVHFSPTSAADIVSSAISLIAKKMPPANSRKGQDQQNRTEMKRLRELAAKLRDGGERSKVMGSDEDVTRTAAFLELFDRVHFGRKTNVIGQSELLNTCVPAPPPNPTSLTRVTASYSSQGIVGTP
jgi:hypothetical protein